MRPPVDTGAAGVPRLDLLLATGGTGGHVYPALAVAHEARSRGLRVMLLGQRGGMEERLAAEAAVPFVGVAAGKWHRGRPDPRQAWRALVGMVQAVRVVGRLRPRRVVGFGGFASFPGCVAAVVHRVPLVLHEGNAFPSRVNRWFARRAALVVSAQAEALPLLAGARASVVVPFPVREHRVERATARARLGLPQDAVVTLVMGGSQGSLTLNQAVPVAYRALGDLASRVAGRPHHVLHSAGPALLHDLQERCEGLEQYHTRPYLDAPTAWSAADLAITRAGVGTLSEAALHGVPLVMVPLPSSAEDHQLHNARAVASADAGEVVEQRDLRQLPHAWSDLLEPTRRASAAAAMRARSPEGAARRMVDALLEVGAERDTVAAGRRADGPAVDRGAPPPEQKRTPTP